MACNYMQVKYEQKHIYLNSDQLFFSSTGIHEIE